jgi:hypothetical protein
MGDTLIGGVGFTLRLKAGASTGLEGANLGGWGLLHQLVADL